MTSNVSMKIISGLAAGVAGFMAVGSYKAHVGTWQNEADVKDRNKSMAAIVYRESLTHTGNSFVPSMIHYLNRPDLFFGHKLRRVGTYLNGFGRDVIWNNLLPLTLGTLAVVWGFNINTTKALSRVGQGLGKVAKYTLKGIKAVGSALKAISPKISASQILSYVKPTTAKGVLATAASAVLGLVLLPYMFFDAARGDKSTRMAEDYLHRRL